MSELQYNLNTKNLWFPDQTEPIYDPTDPISDYQFKEYWRRERDRCINGFSLADGQVKIPGRLYWHTVYWKIAAYVEKDFGGNTMKVRELITPFLLDTVWDVFNDIQACSNEGLFYILVGSRDFGKSITAASCAGWQYTFFPKSEAIISAAAYNYVKLATDKIEDGLLNVHPIFRKQRVTSDWKKEIVAGWKDKKTGLISTNSSFSTIKVRNYENGSNTMAAIGSRPGFHLIDEIGALQNLIACFKDSEGAWWSGGGNKPSCLAMLAGTGGDMEVGKEAAEMFFNPEAYRVLSFPNPEQPGGKMGRFVSALRAKLKYKDKQTLASYLGIQHPDLERIHILVSDEKRAKEEWWDVEYANAVKSGNSKTVLKFKAFWPLQASDSFLVLTKNDYNIEAAKQQQQRIRTNGITGDYIELYHDGEKIRHRFENSPDGRNRMPVTEFPVNTQSKDCPIQVWEFPVLDAPYSLYTAGVDSITQFKSSHSDSLAAIYIFKRMHDIASEKYQDTIVAAYVARPDKPDEWNEQARLLIKWYNARTLVENDDVTFINYMIAKGDGHYLEDQPQWLRMYVPNPSPRDKGISRASEKVRIMLHSQLKKYLDETVRRETDEFGSVIREVTGVTRVLDPMLLEEIINFNETEGNYDREVACSLAIALANHLDPIIGKAGTSDERVQSLFDKKPYIRGSKLFNHQSHMFRNRRSRMFTK